MITIDKYGQSVNIFDGSVNMFFDKVPIKRGVYIIKATGMVWVMEYVQAPFTDFVINGVQITTIEEFTTQFALAIPLDDGGGGGGGIVTADNGLNLSTATNVQLGGGLLGDTSITGGSHSLDITDVTTFSFLVGNSGAAFAGLVAAGTSDVRFIASSSLFGGDQAFLELVQIPGTNNQSVRLEANDSGGGITSFLKLTSGTIEIGGQAIQEFADNSAAISGGLTDGMLYRTVDVLKIVHG